MELYTTKFYPQVAVLKTYLYSTQLGYIQEIIIISKISRLKTSQHIFMNSQN